MKKLFGEINLTWKKLIIFAILIAIYTAAVATIPIFKNTSFADISIQFEWWILFGIIIICNSKSPKDSALKCFIFFLISQPLIYLFQVPFSSMGFGLFKYYKYWFIWTLLTLPMGFIGYYIKKNNIISAIILIPMLVLLTFLGLGYLSAAVENFPHHLLSFISCYLIIIVCVLCILDKLTLRLLCFGVVVAASVILIVINGGLIAKDFEVYRDLNEMEIEIVGDPYVSFFSGTKKGEVTIIKREDGYSLRITGKRNGQYQFDIKDEENEYPFEYYFDKEQQTVIVKKK